jgi:glycogen debranching enzyme
MTASFNKSAEWLETGGLGGFASGTVSGRRTRRYHALLLAATTPPTGRFVLVNGFDAWIQTPTESFALSSQHYTPDVVHPDGAQWIDDFTSEPWPRWVYRLPNGVKIEHELFVPHETATVVLRWRMLEGSGPALLKVRPFFSGRNYHSLHHENAGFQFSPEATGQGLVWRPYPGVPGIISASNGDYQHELVWYRNFLYTEERSRGLDDAEDLASPGIFQWDLSQGDAVWLLSAENLPGAATASAGCAEERRAQFQSPLHRAADAYLVRRGHGRTIIAGYPWFTDWGRDTFIALRGLCLATGRLDEAQQILTDWAGVVSEGMLPNRFPDQGEQPEFNSVDASLWYVIAAHEFLAANTARQTVSPAVQAKIQGAIEAILNGYAQGTRYGIRLDGDGLLAAGVPGVQLTWMDVKIGDWVVTPRIGKPVEVQSLWLNALWIGGRFSSKWKQLAEKGRQAFQARFWNEAGGFLHDVVDPDHRLDSVDSTFRPNQILAIGGLPRPLLEGNQARCVVDAVETRLWTPLGLRSLAPDAPGYVGRYEGGVFQRDSCYHQGTVWPWLIGPFVEAWVRTRGNTDQAKQEARKRFVEPLLQHLQNAGLGHVSEIVDGDAPYTPRGCPFQAWSLGELLRLEEVVLAPSKHARKPQKARKRVTVA